MSTIITEQIKIWGIVQGVGFRPFVAKIADRLHMKGQVLNLGGLVQLILTDEPARIDSFLDVLAKEKPEPAEIVHISRTPLPLQEFEGFSIIQSREVVLSDEEAVMIPADLSICPSCMAEMNDPTNRRYRHPFISCMACGPRYTIIDRVPYDRHNTTMSDFHMCPACNKEYTTLDDRRYHAQTISCHDCGPVMKIRLPGGKESTSQTESRENSWLESAVSILKEGGVIAMKSVGGYHLLADPRNPKGVASLRTIKQRDEKPFAVLFKDIPSMGEYCKIGETEEELLTSSAKPILLLEQLGEGAKMVESHKSRFIGGFLPSMGGQYMLLEAFGGPLIATSANYSGMPILYQNEEMFGLMDKQPLIQAVYYHDRRIQVSTEDSVVRVIDGQPQMIRRSRGYAPVPLYMDSPGFQLLATGPQLKNAFALSKGSYAYVSQYFGDLDSLEIQDQYAKNVDRMSALFDVHPEGVVCDMHPLYATTEFAKKYGQQHDLTVIPVQHHHAHVASVMAEHNLKGLVIGVSFDGTGYGTDGKIWGGEFLLCREETCQRLAHLKYIRMIGGDSSMKDARKSALSILHDRDRFQGTDAPTLQEQPQSGAAREIVLDLRHVLDYAVEHGTLEQTASDRLVVKAIENNINVIESSSMGRIFDGVAALLGICTYNRYEGQCAIALEDAADQAVKHPGKSRASDLALEFHQSVSRMILRECMAIRDETHGTQVALTGGVFQNKILMEQTVALLRENGFQPYYNISVSPNDGGIALGQLYVAQHLMKKMKTNEGQKNRR